MIYLLTAIRLSPGGSTLLHTNKQLYYELWWIYSHINNFCIVFITENQKNHISSSHVTVSHVEFLDKIRARSGRNCVQNPTCLLVHRQHGTAELQYKQTLAPSPHLVTLSFRLVLPPLQRQANFKNNPTHTNDIELWI